MIKYLPNSLNLKNNIFSCLLQKAQFEFSDDTNDLFEGDRKKAAARFSHRHKPRRGIDEVSQPLVILGTAQTTDIFTKQRSKE